LQRRYEDGRGPRQDGQRQRRTAFWSASGNSPKEEVVIHNLKYWGAQSNDGFRMRKSKHEAFEDDDKFAYHGTNGFLTTIHYSGMAKTSSTD
jgi:hypothetical protein